MTSRAVHAMQMPMAEPTILAALTAAVLRAAREVGADVDALRAEASLTGVDLGDPDGRIPVALHLRLIAAIARLQPPIGLELGSRLGTEGMGVVGWAMQHGATLGDALGWLERYRSVVFDGVLARTERDERTVAFCHVVHPALAALREPAEIWAAAHLSTLRRLTGRDLLPLEVAFPHGPPADDRRHRALFRAPIRWDAPRIELRFDAAILQLPLTRADRDLFRYLERRVEALRAELQETSIVTQARLHIEQALAHGEPAIGDVAKRMGIAERTLQRRLGEEGRSFSALLDEIRRERAELLLRDPRLGTGEIAFLLGYSEPAAFFRAFRRWTGTTPRAWREGPAPR